MRYGLIIIIIIALGASKLMAQDIKDTTATIKVHGACIMCKERIENALKIKGIKKAVWDIPTQMLTVTYDAGKIILSDVHDKMAAVGHDTELKKARDGVYKELPDCCHYRDLTAVTKFHSARQQ